MIKITGIATLNVPYSMELDMSEDEWDALSEGEQNSEIEDRVNWISASRNATVDDVEVHEVSEV